MFGIELDNFKDKELTLLLQPAHVFTSRLSPSRQTLQTSNCYDDPVILLSLPLFASMYFPFTFTLSICVVFLLTTTLYMIKSRYGGRFKARKTPLNINLPSSMTEALSHYAWPARATRMMFSKLYNSNLITMYSGCAFEGN